MKRVLLAAAVAVAFFSASDAQAQTKVKPGKLANTSVAPAMEPEWPAEPETWGVQVAPASPGSNWETAGTPDAVDPMMQSSGVLVAPGMSSSPYRGTSTDYNGRPVAKPKSKRPRSVQVAQDDPMMQSSGVMLAPGMNTAPYRGTSTDYNGRPLRKPVAATTAAAQADVSQEPMAAGW